MRAYHCLILVIIVQYISAQTLHGPRGIMPIANDARRSPNTVIRNMPINNPFLRNMPSAGNNFAYPTNSNFITNDVNGNLAYIASRNLATNAVNGNFNKIANPNTVPANLASGKANQILATNANDVNALKKTTSGNVSPNYGHPISTNNNVEPVFESPIPNGNVANKMPAGFKPKTMKLNIGNPFAIKNGIHGKLDNQNINLQIMADNLEVSGTLSVSGKLPVYATVTINGNIPTDGTASVSYSCGTTNRPVLAGA